MPMLRLYESGHSVAGGNELALVSRLPSAAVRSSSDLHPMASFVITNTGTTDSYIRKTADSTPTAQVIPAGETREVGPVDVAGDPDLTLDCSASGGCLVDSYYQGAKS